MRIRRWCTGYRGISAVARSVRGESCAGGVQLFPGGDEWGGIGGERTRGGGMTGGGRRCTVEQEEEELCRHMIRLVTVRLTCRAAGRRPQHSLVSKEH